VLEINQLVGVMFSGLSGLVIEDVRDEGELIRVRARSREVPVPCPGCAVQTTRVHAWCERVVADVPLDGRPVVVDVRVRRLACRDWRCPRRTFREQVSGVLERYQRKTARLAAQIGAVVRELAGRAGARVLPALGVPISRHAALRALLRIPLPAMTTPRVLGVDDFSLRRCRTYATVLIDAETRRRVDVLPDRRSDTLAAWLREHPGVEIVCRDGAAGYADAVHQALPDALQVGDRWHIWHNFAQAVGKEVAVHSGCWASASRVRKLDGGKTTTLARWQQVHDLLDAGVGLLECARRLNLALNTIKRYARIKAPEQMRRAPQYRPTRSSIPTASTCVNAGPKTLRSPSCNFCARSGNAATPAAKISSTATSPRAASRATDPPSRPAGFLGCCSPDRTPSGLTSKNSSTRPPVPARR
jgi:hypothetical protein